MAKACRDAIGVINCVKSLHVDIIVSHPIGAIDVVRDQYLDRRTINQLEDATRHLTHVAVFLTNLEELHPANGISRHLRPLFLEAHDGFSLMCSHPPRSTASRSTRQRILKLLKIIEPENIAKRIKASQPSRSSSPITMDMAGFVESLFGYLHRALFFISVGPPNLRHLQVFFTLISKRGTEHESMKDLFNHVENVAYTAAQLCLLGLSCNMDYGFSKLLEGKSLPFSPELRQIYLNALIGFNPSRSKTTMNDKDMLDFVSALQDGSDLYLQITTPFPDIAVPAAGFLFSAITPNIKDKTPRVAIIIDICFIPIAIGPPMFQ